MTKVVLANGGNWCADGYLDGIPFSTQADWEERFGSPFPRHHPEVVAEAERLIAEGCGIIRVQDIGDSPWYRILEDKGCYYDGEFVYEEAEYEGHVRPKVWVEDEK